MRATRTIAWILLLVVSASAQESQHFYFSSPATVSEVAEQGLPLGTTRVNDFATVITVPEFTVGTTGSRTEFGLSYHPEFERFMKYSELNSVNHMAAFHFTHKINLHWTFDARNSFLQTHDPSRSVRDIVFLLPRSRFTENILSSSLDYRPSTRTTFSLGFNHTVSFLSLPSSLPTSRFDQMAAALTGSLSRMVTRRQRLTASYSLLSFRDLNAGNNSLPLSPALSHWANSLSFTDRIGSEEGMFVELTGGVLRSHFTYYTVAGRVGRAWNSFTADAGYSRQISILSGLASGEPGGVIVPTENLITPATGFLAGSISQVATLKLAGSVGGRIGMDLRVAAGMNSEALQSQTIKSITARLRVAYRVSERVYPFVGAEYYGQNFNELTLILMDRKRIYAGLTILLSSPRELVDNQAVNLDDAWPAGIPGFVSQGRPRSRNGQNGGDKSVKDEEQ